MLGAQTWNLNFTVVGAKHTMSHRFLGLKLLPEIKLAHQNTNLLSLIQITLRAF